MGQSLLCCFTYEFLAKIIILNEVYYFLLYTAIIFGYLYTNFDFLSNYSDESEDKRIDIGLQVLKLWYGFN
jgi:hypothetical protein